MSETLGKEQLALEQEVLERKISKFSQDQITEYCKNLEKQFSFSVLDNQNVEILLQLYLLEKRLSLDLAIENLIRRIFLVPLSNSPNLHHLEKIFIQQDLSDLILDILSKLIEQYDNLLPLQRRSLFVNALAFFWNTPKLHSSSKWKRVFTIVYHLLNKLIQEKRIEEEMYVHFFFYHIYGNNLQTIKEWEWFSDKVEKPASHLYFQYAQEHKLPPYHKEKNRRRKRIGFLLDRIAPNSPWKVFYSFLEQIMHDVEFRRKNKVFVYSLAYINKSPDRQELVEDLQKIGVEFFSPLPYFIKDGFFYSHLQKALLLRQKIIDDKIDILISHGFGYDISNFLFSTRTAPKQIFWSHGNCTSKVLNIDLCISHFEQECNDREWKIFHIPISKKFLIGSVEEKEKGFAIKEEFKKTFGEDVVILGTIGRLIKIDSEEYLKIIADIMNDHPKTIYLACGGGNQETIKEKIMKYNIPMDRFIFTGPVNPHIYGWVIDIWLNTYPLVQGLSQDEFRAKGHGVILETSQYINCKNYANDYEAIKDSYFKDPVRKKLFYEFYGLQEEINESFDYYANRINWLKKKQTSFDLSIIEKCFLELKNIKDCKKRWKKYCNLIINNKEFCRQESFFIYELGNAFQKINTVDIQKTLN